MKAIAKCPKCGKTMITTCKECIENEVAINLCDCNGIVKNVKWKLIDKSKPSFKEDMGWEFGKGKKDGPINQMRKLNKKKPKK